jgi:TolA-binding protein
MSKLRKILGTSTLSLIVVIWGLSMVCSGRVPEMYTEDNWMTEENIEENDKSDLMKQLAALDDQATELEENQRREILAALGIEPGGARMTGGEEDFLTEELFLDLEVEIAELEELSKRKAAMIDSLKMEMDDVDLQLAALTNIVEPTPTPTPTPTRYAESMYKTNGAPSEYSMFYQDALDDVYTHNYVSAIAKFQQLLKEDSSNDLADNSQYWIGESYYALGNFEQAIAEFEKVYAFDNNNKSDDAQFMIGLAYLKIGDKNLAELELKNLLSFFNKSEYVTKAELRLTELNI